MFHKHNWETTHETMTYMNFTNLLLSSHKRLVIITVKACTCGKEIARWKDATGRGGRLSPEFIKKAIEKEIF